MATALYDGYEQWKGWSADTFMQPTPAECCHYAAELRGVPLAGEDVLEIGFGNGGFLGWAAAQGARLHGSEISARALALAERNGVATLPVDLGAVAADQGGRFALIAAFDVLEHLTRAEIEALFDQVARLLRPGGHFLARFPNGQSPFGRVHQHADMTHVSILSAPILRQLVRDRPFRLVRAGDPRPVVHGALPVRIAKHARNLARRAADLAIKRLFGFDAPLGTDTLLLLQRH